ncbi:MULTISPECIES: AraC family transcriptional regulator [unclassified Paenibacillus]|uniref:AraC family transcriptional regulator n=1 Tax=unclassified Paenibacillus TaxID=185978 RepID=UPI00020D6CC2|nr:MULTISPECIES: AraC family transcriptional regulator [unclassified Paenibacillus]EGL20121.1 transcriptional regulator, AraC family [Paenibacillus sp. HGF7]EPD82300.1 hypothetical protein HMPREF1207_04126 [Paenibacillus sp. HGH0039]
MKFNEQVAIWNQTAVKIFDIRHTVMNPGERLEDYRLPASAYIYGTRGAANLQLDGVVHRTRQYYLLHGAKGMNLEIEAKEEFEFYLLFYKAKLAFTNWRKLRDWLEQRSPFEIQYGFEPDEPRTLFILMSSMKRTLKSSGSLGNLQIKGMFYQFVHEVMQHRIAAESDSGQKDLVSMVTQYLHTHYHEVISLDLLARQYKYSPRYLSMKFKQQTGTSPIEYLIQYRINEARKLLSETDETLGVIAEHVGYSDEYYFSRLFKKYTGLSPSRYQAQARARENLAPQDNPSAISRSSIGLLNLRRYSDNDNHYHYSDGGFLTMKRIKKSSLILGTLISLTLLLSACSGGVNPASNSSASTTNVSASPSPYPDKISTETRIVSTVKGDVVVPAEPKRVVVLYMLGDVVALGVNPVGISEIYDGAAFSEQLKGVQSLGHWDEANPEAVLSLEPDLIIVSSENSYKKLKDIAPTVFIPADQITTEARIQKLGEIFGKKKEADQFMEAFNDKVKASREKLQAAGILDKTVSIVEGERKGMMVIESKHYGRGSQIVYDYLGMKAPEIIQKKIDLAKDVESETVSLEVIPQYIGDFVLRSTWEGMDNLMDHPVWNRIPAVKAGRIIEAPFGLFYYTDLYSLSAQLDYVTNSLLNNASKF